MNRVGLSLVVVALTSVPLAGWQAGNQSGNPRPPATAAKQDGRPVNADAAVLQDFNKRIADYIKLHEAAAKKAPPLKETNDPARITAAQEALAAEIRRARATAKPGDIFTPDVRRKFRSLLYPEMKGEDGQDARKVLKDDAPQSAPLKVNAKYPDIAPLPTVPAKLLLNLPTLPEELEYRIVDRHLILLDTKAEIVVDYIPNAIR